MFKLNAERILGFVQPKTKIESSAVNTLINVVQPNTSVGVLEGMTSSTSEQALNSLYREIYLYDTTAGPTVDLLSNLPWSNFTLTGVKDPKILKIYEDTMEELGVVNLMIELSVSFLVLGKVIGSLLFDDNRGLFTDLAIFNPDDCEITPIPLRGYDPKIDLKISGEMKKFLRSTDPRDKEAKSEIPPKLMSQLLNKAKIELEPLNTLYLARSYVPGIPSISYYTRVLPIWLIEKALMRGTIIGSWRRQRSILHVVAGDDEWEPTDDQLANITSLFINADQDPQGAVITTRKGVEASELRSGSDFWKVSDEWDIFSNAKMRALGVNESFLSGETSYNSMEVALSVFIENLRNYREFMTRNVLNDKVFLLLAKYHGFKHRTQAELSHHIRIESKHDKYRIFGSKNLANSSQYITPRVQWHKDLTPRSDTDYLEILGTAEEKGIPIPLAMIASAAGVDIDEVLDSTAQDIILRKKIKAYKDKIAAIGDTEEGEGGGMFGKVDLKDLPDEKILKAREAAGLIQGSKNIKGKSCLNF